MPRDPLEDDFPLGDGVADTEAVVECPYCGESVEIMLDPGGGTDAQYIEDCEVCCQPWLVTVHYNEDGTANVSIAPTD